jgi:hypothetical protein
VPLGYDFRFRGHPVDPGVMLTADLQPRDRADPGDAAPRSVFHARMEAFGLDFHSTGISVGHRVPRSKGGSGVGANLFAQHTEDNTALGAEVASDEEHFFMWRLDLLSNKEQFLQSKLDHSKTLRAFLRGPTSSRTWSRIDTPSMFNFLTLEVLKNGKSRSQNQQENLLHRRLAPY